MTTEKARMAGSPRDAKRDLAYHGLRLALDFCRDAQEPTAGHRELALEGVDARLAARHRGERRRHLAHAVQRHVDAGLHNHGIGHWLAAQLVLEADGHDSVVAFLDL